MTTSFGDNGTLTGSFTTNDARNTLLDFDITTSSGAGIGNHYTLGNSDSISTSLPFILVLHSPANTSDKNLMEVTFSSLPSPGGSAPITLGQFSSFEQNTPDVKRFIEAGSVVAVPEPSTAALIADGGLGLLGYAARRRRG